MGSWFLCLNLQGWISILHKKIATFLFSLCIYVIVSSRDNSAQTHCAAQLLFKLSSTYFFNTAGIWKFPIIKINLSSPFSLLIKNKLWSIPESCYLKNENNKTKQKKAVLLVTLETEVLFEMAVALFLQNFRLISVPQLPSVMPLKFTYKFLHILSEQIC